jgi:hypothetical protein
MPNVGLAESVLSLFTQPEIAASIAGDLAEEFAAKQFWLHVIRTALALCFQQFLSRPRRVVILVLTGFAATEIAVSGILASGLILETLVEPLLIGILIAGLSRGREMTVCALTALSSLILSITLGLFGARVRLVWHFLQWNILASIVFVCCGAFIRGRANFRAKIEV